MKPILAATTLFALVAASYGAHALMAGDVAKGHQFAQQICSECHTVEKGQRSSPNGQAPIEADADVRAETSALPERDT